MTNIINKQPNSNLTSPLFEAGPILKPFGLGAVLNDLEQLKALILHRVGKVQHYTLYPHRVFKQRAWHIKVVGDNATTYLLLNISGHYQFINEPKASRLSLYVADDIDAFWFAYALADKLSITPTIPDGVFQGGNNG